MTGEINQAIQDILANGQVPPRVTNRLLMAILLEVVNRQDRTDQSIKDLSERVRKVEDYPSLLSLLWRHPKTTVTFILFIFGLLALAYQAGGLLIP